MNIIAPQTTQKQHYGFTICKPDFRYNWWLHELADFSVTFEKSRIWSVVLGLYIHVVTLERGQGEVHFHFHLYPTPQSS